ncbi:MAG TPA: o-succinylbenzoate synthase [Bacteroidia bacterium]|nr:o-succinylbenzoate synthase [Bacteroidia bacterium]
MYKAEYKKYLLKFKHPSGTSRGVLTEKPAYFIKIWEDGTRSVIGIGECSILKGLSVDDVDNYEEFLKYVCENINVYIQNLTSELLAFPSILFGVETALKDLKNNGTRILFPSNFTGGLEGIPTNGLIWMGTVEFIKKQLKEKIEAGFRCIKIKIGAIGFEEELSMLSELRMEYQENDLEIRLDANGAFADNEALNKLEQLAVFKIHSIEQPIKQGNREEMAKLCRRSPIPIALDEELIGVLKDEEKERLVSQILPGYLIIKPSLLGGFKHSEEWIEIANKYKVGWWITSALESNIGLNAIAQWTYTLNSKLPQGLGTGQLYTNNIPSPLLMEDTKLWYLGRDWNLDRIETAE